LSATGLRPLILSTPRPAAPAPKNGPAFAVTRLVLSAFRSYRDLRLEVDPRPVVLTGVNGGGKTNLLEALSFLSPGGGLRGARLADVARRGAPEGEPRPWAVAATVSGPDGAVDIGTGQDPSGGQRRVVRIDGAPAGGQAALTDKVTVVWLTPAMDRLFNDAPQARRRFLDRLVFGFDPGHARRISAFQRALRERARVLRGGGGDPAWLDAIEDTMAGHAVAVTAARHDAVARLRGALGTGVGPFPAATLDLVGEIDDWLADMPAVDVEARLRETLARARARDAVAGGAAAGPHRGDLVVGHVANGLAAAQCSTGEQKMLLISLILASARLHAARGGAVPVLLLDEVAAHLDADHRAALIDELIALGGQAWLTGTDPAAFADFGARAQYLTVADGAITGPRISAVPHTGTA